MLLRLIATFALTASVVVAGTGTASAMQPSTPHAATHSAVNQQPKSITFSLTPAKTHKGIKWELVAYNLTDNTEWATRIPRKVAQSNPFTIREWISTNAPTAFLSPSEAAATALGSPKGSEEAKSKKKSKKDRKEKGKKKRR